MRGPPGSSQYKTASRLTSHPQHLRNLLPVFSCELAALPRFRDIVVPLERGMIFASLPLAHPALTT